MSPALKVRTLPIADLVPAPYNPRLALQPSDRRYQKLARSLREFGLVEPLVWNETTGHVAIYQGLPIDLFGGVKLYREVSESTLAYASLSAATRKQLFDHRIRSESDAKAAVRRAEQAGP